MSYKIKGEAEVQLGFGLPRHTTASRLAYTPPTRGYQVFDTDLDKVFIWNLVAWKETAFASDYVSIAGDQTITGEKTITNNLQFLVPNGSSQALEFRSGAQLTGTIDARPSAFTISHQGTLLYMNGTGVEVTDRLDVHGSMFAEDAVIQSNTPTTELRFGINDGLANTPGMFTATRDNLTLHHGNTPSANPQFTVTPTKFTVSNAQIEYAVATVDGDEDLALVTKKYILDKITSASGASTLNDLLDVSVTAPAVGDLLFGDAAGDYANRQLVAADISDAGTTLATFAQGATADTALQNITGESIKSLSDVFTTMTPTDGQALVFDTTNGWQAETLAGGVTGLTDLSDVTIATPATGHVLVRDATDFKNRVLVKADISDFAEGDYATGTEGDLAATALQNLTTTSIGTLSDVDITTAAPTAGQALVWNATNNEFEPGTVGGGVASLDDLADVTVTAPVTGHVLIHAPGGFQNRIFVKSDINDFSDVDYATAAQGVTANSALQNITAESIGDLTDVDITTVAPTAGQALVWSAANSAFEPGGNGDSSDKVLKIGDTMTGALTLDAASDLVMKSAAGPTGNIAFQSGAGGDDATIGYDQSSFGMHITSGDGFRVDVSNGTATIASSGASVAVQGSTVTVTGNLTVAGTTTTVNSNNVNIGDAIITLNSDEVGTPSQNGGIEIERGTGINAQFIWNETTDKWQASDNVGILENIALVSDIPTSVGDLSDVDITTAAPTAGQALVWNATNNEFEPGTATVDLSNYVDRTTAQAIAGLKTFSTGVDIADDITLNIGDSGAHMIYDTATTPSLYVQSSTAAGQAYLCMEDTDIRMNSGYVAAGAEIASYIVANEAYLDFYTPGIIDMYADDDITIDASGSNIDISVGSGQIALTGNTTGVRLSDSGGFRVLTGFVAMEIDSTNIKLNTDADTRLRVAVGSDFAGEMTVLAPSNGSNPVTLDYFDNNIPSIDGLLSDITGESIADLSNVAFPAAPTSGQVLSWNNTTSKFEPVTIAGGVTSLDGLTDVTIAAPATGHVLVRDATDFKNRVLVKADVSDFVEGDYATGAEGDLAASALQNLTATSIGTLSDVDITTAAPTAGQALVWNATNSEFEPGSPTVDLSNYVTLDGAQDITGDKTFLNSIFLGPQTVTNGITADTNAFKFTLGGVADVMTVNSGGVLLGSNLSLGKTGVIGTPNASLTLIAGAGSYQAGRAAARFFNGGGFDIVGSTGTGTNKGPDCKISGGVGGPTNGDGGDLLVSGGNSQGTGNGGNIILKPGTGTTDGTVNVFGTIDYETLVVDDDDIPNKKYVDDAIVVATGSSVLNDLTDVTITTPATGHVLVRDATDFKNRVLVKADVSDFVEGDYATAAQGATADSALQNLTATSIGTLSDVDITTAAPTAGQALVWNATNSEFEPGTVTTDLSNYVTLDGAQAIAGDKTFSGNTIMSGNLTVNGTVTTVNSNNVNIADSIITLNSDEVGTPSQNGGIEIERGTDTNAQLIWSESSDRWEAGIVGSTEQLIRSSDMPIMTNYVSKVTTGEETMAGNLKISSNFGTVTINGTGATGSKLVFQDGGVSSGQITTTDTSFVVQATNNASTGGTLTLPRAKANKAIFNSGLQVAGETVFFDEVDVFNGKRISYWPNTTIASNESDDVLVNKAYVDDAITAAVPPAVTTTAIHSFVIADWTAGSLTITQATHGVTASDTYHVTAYEGTNVVVVGVSVSAGGNVTLSIDSAAFDGRVRISV